MNLHKEINFETEICEHLAANGWLYSNKDASGFVRGLALFPEDVLAWVQETQPDAWEALTKSHGSSAADTLLNRLRQSLDQKGTLHVLRDGFDVLGLRKKLKMAEFKPAFSINPDIVVRYNANRLRVVRQVRYSVHNENSIDLVLFLNGIPVATAELKTDFTQSIGDAVDQYRFDRDPSPKGQDPEPLLAFPSGALVHFAVSSSEVQMTTKLSGPQTRFLPFNLGDDGGPGNPVNPGGHKTAYLWEQVWDREGWLEILGRYLVAERDKKKQISSIIFPRYHQLDCTRRLTSAVLNEGAGKKYLIQHSAGSGKTKTIAWTAHFFGALHGPGREPHGASRGSMCKEVNVPGASALPLTEVADTKVFDSVIVVSDRTVIDGQLQEELAAFERKKGVVATISGKSGSKSAELAEALSGDKKIVVCTIQTFPFALEAVRELAATEGKRFAVIVDEAHSSQTGEAAAKLKKVLSAEEQKAIEDGGEVSSEDLLAAEMASRAGDTAITYVAFTATPKAKTLELFGRRPDPAQPASEGNLPQPFHVYFQTGFDQPLLCAMYVDKRLAGIQAVQTLSRLNRCYEKEGVKKEDTFVLDFVNEAEEILDAFKAYYATAELSAATDPNIVLNLRAKLDDAGFYDEFEVDRVVDVVLNPASKQKQLEAAIQPVADRLLKQFSAARAGLKAAKEAQDDRSAQAARDTMEALMLFRTDMVTYQRAYTFLSQIFDYGNTEFEKRSIFYKHLIRLLKFGREREGVDLSQVVLTHHSLKNKGHQAMNPASGEYPKLNPMGEAGTALVREKLQARLSEIIEKVNDLFKGELTDNNKLVYVNDVLKGKLLESETLTKQASSNTKEQFANSPDLKREILSAVINALDAHTEMSTQAINSEDVQRGLKEILLGPAKLYETLRGQA